MELAEKQRWEWEWCVGCVERARNVLESFIGQKHNKAHQVLVKRSRNVQLLKISIEMQEKLLFFYVLAENLKPHYSALDNLLVRSLNLNSPEKGAI